MVYYEHDYRSKAEIVADREQFITNSFYRYENEIKQLKAENADLQRTIDKLLEILKASDSEYGKYLQLKDKYDWGGI